MANLERNDLQIAASRSNSKTSADISIPTPVTRSSITQNLADPVLSGGATWVGTLISIVAAVAAWRQARAAKRLTVRIADEQKRNAINATKIHLNSIENHLTPLWETPPRRGLKVSKIVGDAKHECHRALSGLSKERDKEIRVLLQNFEAKLDHYHKEYADWPQGLVATSRRELQDLSSMCNEAIDKFAQDK